MNARVSACTVLLLTPQLGDAATFCVSNEADLRQALASAATNGQDDVIRIRTGTFYTGGQKFSLSTTEAYGLAVSGGWSDFGHVPCAVQSGSASATILDGQDTTAVLDVEAYAFSTNGASTVSVSNLTLRNGYSSTKGEPAGLFLSAGDQVLRLEHTILISHTQTTASPDIFSNAVTITSLGDIYVINNAMGDLHSAYADLGIFTNTAAQTVYLNNNTLALSADGFPALLDAAQGTAFRLVNNAIVAPNPHGFGGLVFNSRNAQDLIRVWLFNNVGLWSVYDGFNGIVVEADSGNHAGIDPLFEGPLDFRPAPGSPLANAGLNSPYGGVSTVDLDGNPRVDLGVIDVGAWESTHERIFADGFE